jgi:hypothetical protein
MSSEHVIKMKLKGKKEEQKTTLPKAIQEMKADPEVSAKH